MKTKDKRNRKGTIAALVIAFAALIVIAYFVALPMIKDEMQKRENAGIDVLAKYEENTDMIGWIQIPGTGISYPVMKGEKYLHLDFSGEYSDSGMPFVEDTWSPQDINTLMYAHNMWMYRSMFNPLHEFKDKAFFDSYKTIKFYVICGEVDKHVEKRTFEITHCILTSVDSFGYTSAQYITEEENLADYLLECDSRALHKRKIQAQPEKVITLSTCSYHIRGKNGRLVIVGRLTDTKEQRVLDEDNSRRIL